MKKLTIIALSIIALLGAYNHYVYNAPIVYLQEGDQVSNNDVKRLYKRHYECSKSGNYCDVEYTQDQYFIVEYNDNNEPIARY